MNVYTYFCVLCVVFMTNRGENDVPEITLPPTDKKVIEDATVSFICKASGNPLPNFQWRKSGEIITATSLRYTVLTMPQGSVLRIESAKPSRDDAIFECAAENSAGDIRASARLEVYPRDQMPSGYPHILENPSLNAVEKDRNTNMACSASGSPEPTIMWLKDHIPINTTDPRLRVLSGGSLQILKSLESDEGKYECVAENSVGVAYSYGANLYVRVRRIPPHISIPPERVEVVRGGSVNLSCTAVGSPMPYVKWRLGALELTPEDEVPIGKSVLTLTDVRETATYTCVATSVLGSIEADAEVRVKVRRFPPHFSIPPETVEVVPGGSVNLSCVAVGSPMPYVMWRLGSLKLTPEDEVPIGKNVLTLTDVRETATYTCVAASYLGNIEAEAEVRVKETTEKETMLEIAKCKTSEGTEHAATRETLVVTTAMSPTEFGTTTIAIISVACLLVGFIAGQ